MKTVLVVLGLALTVGALPQFHDVELKPVDAEFLAKQMKVLSLFDSTKQIDPEAEYFKLGMEWSIEKHLDQYSNKQAVEEFLTLYKYGELLPKFYPFSIFYENMRDEAIALFHLFYYAKDFETFYKTAAWAKIHINQGLFFYSYYVAVFQRPDTQGIVLPAPYETFPEFYLNQDLVWKIQTVKMHDGIYTPEYAADYGVQVEDQFSFFYANYSTSLTYPNEEQRLSYFTEDIGLNSYYFYFHTHMPFWWNSDKYSAFKERRGEVYFYFYQQLLARYYLERLTNGLDTIPEFSWYSQFKTGYSPLLTSTFVPFAQRSNFYDLHTPKNYEHIRFLDTYEKTFFQYLQKGQFKAFNKDVNFHDDKSMNFVGNYWQTNADLYGEDFTKDYQQSYEIIARHVLGAAPKPSHMFNFMPSALDFYQTSLRDPAFYQLYKRIVQYMIDYKQYMTPYTKEDLYFKGVKINGVTVSELVTYFDYYDYNATNIVALTPQEMKTSSQQFIARQPRLNHKTFTLDFEIQSDMETDAVFKVFIGPKYDSNGYPMKLEENWMNFFELDYFTHKLKAGANKIERKSTEFPFFKEDSVPMSKLYKYLKEGKVPHDMSVMPEFMPKRMMLPKGTRGGYPFQLFVFAYPRSSAPSDQVIFKNFVMDNKPFGYPLDRPMYSPYFKQPNMYFKDISIYHKNQYDYYELNIPAYFTQQKL